MLPTSTMGDPQSIGGLVGGPVAFIAGVAGVRRLRNWYNNLTPADKKHIYRRIANSTPGRAFRYIASFFVTQPTEAENRINELIDEADEEKIKAEEIVRLAEEDVKQAALMVQKTLKELQRSKARLAAAENSRNKAEIDIARQLLAIDTQAMIDARESLQVHDATDTRAMEVVARIKSRLQRLASHDYCHDIESGIQMTETDQAPAANENSLLSARPMLLTATSETKEDEEEKEGKEDDPPMMHRPFFRLGQQGLAQQEYHIDPQALARQEFRIMQLAPLQETHANLAQANVQPTPQFNELPSSNAAHASPPDHVAPPTSYLGSWLNSVFNTDYFNDSSDDGGVA